MAPLGRGGKPGIHTTNQINSYFGSFNAFAEQFKSAAENVEASGWGILTWQPTWRRLEILQAEKHQDLTQWSGIPIWYAMSGNMPITWIIRTGERNI